MSAAGKSQKMNLVAPEGKDGAALPISHHMVMIEIHRARAAEALRALADEHLDEELSDLGIDICDNAIREALSAAEGAYAKVAGTLKPAVRRKRAKRTEAPAAAQAADVDTDAETHS